MVRFFAFWWFLGLAGFLGGCGVVVACVWACLVLWWVLVVTPVCFMGSSSSLTVLLTSGLERLDQLSAEVGCLAVDGVLLAVCQGRKSVVCMLFYSGCF